MAKLKEYPLHDILCTESQIYYYKKDRQRNSILLKKLFVTDEKRVKRKVNTIEVLQNSELSTYKELIIPEKVVSIGGIQSGFTIKEVNDCTNLYSFLRSKKVSDQDKLLVLKKIARGINIESAAGIKLKGILDFGSTFNFGETDNGIEVQYKLTKKNKTKDCGMLKVVGVNNHASNTLTVNDTVIPSGETATVAEASVLDIINTTHKLGKYSNDAIGGPYYECVLSDSQPESGQDVFDGIPETMPGYFVNGGVYSLGYILSHFTDMKNNADFENVVRNMGAGDYMDINVRTGSNTTETKYITFNETPHPDGDVSFDDILTYIRWAKANNEGPWATQP